MMVGTSSFHLKQEQIVYGREAEFLTLIQSSILYCRLLTRRGARAIGLFDRRRLMTESGIFDFPFDFPETLSGENQEFRTGRSAIPNIYVLVLFCSCRDLYRRYLSTPRSKRVNFPFISVPYPFCPNWTAVSSPNIKSVIRNPLLDNEDFGNLQRCFRVLRPFIYLHQPSHDILQLSLPVESLHSLVLSLSNHSSCPNFPTQPLTLSSILCSLPFCHSIDYHSLNDELVPYIDSTLLAVQIIANSRGVPKNRSHLFQMNLKEFEFFIHQQIQTNDGFRKLCCFISSYCLNYCVQNSYVFGMFKVKEIENLKVSELISAKSRRLGKTIKPEI